MEMELNTSTSTANVSRVSNALPLPTLIIYISFSTIGIIGNGLVLYVIARIKELQDTTNLLIVNQSLIDWYLLDTSPCLILSSPCHLFPAKTQYWPGSFGGVWYSNYFYWSTLYSYIGQFASVDF